MNHLFCVNHLFVDIVHLGGVAYCDWLNGNQDMKDRVLASSFILYIKEDAGYQVC